MARTFRILSTACALSLVVFAQVGQILPRMEGTTLNDQKIVLPDPSHYHAIVLVFGFSHKSADQADGWGKRLAKDYSSQPLVGYFEVPVLQSAPGMVRPMIIHGMRKGTPAAEQGHVLPVTQHEAELKKLSGYHGPDDAYAMVAAPDGRVVWQTHGVVTDANYADLVHAVSSLMGDSK
jgi:hypothetical protein